MAEWVKVLATKLEFDPQNPHGEKKQYLHIVF